MRFPIGLRSVYRSIAQTSKTSPMPLKLYQKGKIIEPLRTLYIHAEHPTEKSARNRSLHSKTLSQAQAAPLVAVLWVLCRVKNVKATKFIGKFGTYPLLLDYFKFLAHQFCEKCSILVSRCRNWSAADWKQALPIDLTD